MSYHPPGLVPPTLPFDLRFTVPSSRGGGDYEVTRRRGVWSCTCPATGRCWHKTYAGMITEALGVENFSADLQPPPPDLLRWIRARNRRERAAAATDRESR